MYVVFNHALSPAQERNLEKADRAPRDGPHRADPGDLRAARADQRRQAAGRAGAARSTCRRAWCAAGPTWSASAAAWARPAARARTQLELDRRYIGSRVKMLKDEARQAAKAATRATARARAARRAVGLAGRLHQRRQVDAVQRARHRPRPTRPTSCSPRSIPPRGAYGYPEAGNVVLSDTVGFIRDLPHGAGGRVPRHARGDRARRPAAARGRRVVPVRDEQVAAVNQVLAEIGAAKRPQLLVWNKIDRGPDCEPGVERDQYGRISRVFVSARTGSRTRAAARRDRRVRKSAGDAQRSADRPAGSPYSLNEHVLERPQLGTGSRGPQGPGGGNQGPPDLDELWRNFNRRLSDLFGRARAAATSRRGRRARAAWAAAPACWSRWCSRSGWRAASTSWWKARAAWCSPSASYSQDDRARPALAHAVADPVARDRQPRAGAHAGSRLPQQRAAPRCCKESLMLTDDENIVDLQFAVQYTGEGRRATSCSTMRRPDESALQIAETAMREIDRQEQHGLVLYESRRSTSPTARAT